ncbi:MAG: RNA polymerase sigma factor [Phycisphaerae bacterium]
MMATNADECDQVLIAAAQQGERSALDAFVRRHNGWVRHIVYATLGNTAVVDDVVQHVWTKVWQQIGTLVDRSRWRGWLYRMAKHAAIDEGLKQTRERRRQTTMDAVEVAAPRTAEPLGQLIEAEQHRRILAAIRGLPAIYREPFTLRHLDGWSYAEIGEAMSLPVDTVETRLVRARRLLRAALNDTKRRKDQSPDDPPRRPHSGRSR